MHTDLPQKQQKNAIKHGFAIFHRVGLQVLKSAVDSKEFRAMLGRSFSSLYDDKYVFFAGACLVWGFLLVESMVAFIKIFVQMTYHQKLVQF